MFGTVLTILWLVLIAGAFYMMFRNNQVFNYRMGLLTDIRKASNADILARRPWRWRYDTMDTVSYNYQMIHFWKPVDSFYTDKSFLDPYAGDPNAQETQQVGRTGQGTGSSVSRPNNSAFN